MSDPAIDVVIVGGGSAGAVLAARLSQDPARTVLLLEAGPAYAPDAYPRDLLDANKIADPQHDWGYTSRGTEQTPKLPTPRGKVLGGSSAVNACVALRARPTDFANWAKHGIDGWSYEDVLPTFKLLENTPTADDAYHGRTGPLPIRQRSDAELTPSLRAFVEASVAYGYRRVHDFNGAEQNGADGYPVDVVDGVRQNVGLVYLTAEVRSRPNLTIRGDITIPTIHRVALAALTSASSQENGLSPDMSDAGGPPCAHTHIGKLDGGWSGPAGAGAGLDLGWPRSVWRHVGGADAGSAGRAVPGVREIGDRPRRPGYSAVPGDAIDGPTDLMGRVFSTSWPVSPVRD
jgi:hypothetical protein